MKYDSTVTSLSWIPSEAVTGMNRAVFDSGFGHYDDPPPAEIDDLQRLCDDDRFRFANRLTASIEVDEDGTIVSADYTGGCFMGSTTLALGGKAATFAAVPFPVLREPVEISADGARFVQTVGGHTAVPAPRRVNRPPFVQFDAPTVWTTLALTIAPDGTSAIDVIGASPFPRHWIYGDDGQVCLKVGLADFKEWWRTAFGKHTPWGDQQTPALVTAVETALERELATTIMRGGATPKFRNVAKGATLTEQGQSGDELFLLLNGVLSVEVDGASVAEVGPGAILGERAFVEGGRRTSTLRALTKSKVAVVSAGQIDRHVLESISSGHRREHTSP